MTLQHHIQDKGRLLFTIDFETFPVDVKLDTIKNDMIILHVDNIARLQHLASKTNIVNFVGKDESGRDFMCADLKLFFSAKSIDRVAVSGTAPCIYKDRRMHPRYAYDCELTMQIQSHGEFIVVQCRDISTGGISFYYNPYIKELSKVTIDILNIYTGKRGVYQATVQHSMTDSKGKWYGCQFKNPDDWLVELTDRIVDDLLA